MKTIPAVILFLLGYSCFSQTCDCLSEFRYVKKYYEENHPGFQLNIKPDAKKLEAYNAACKQIENRIGKSKPGQLCIFFLEDYIELLKDHHISIDPNIRKLAVVNENSEQEVQDLFQSAIYKNHERFRWDSVSLVNKLKTKPANSIEGLYKNASGNLMAVIANRTNERDYVGVMLQSSSKLWKYGFEKMELKYVKENVYDVSIYTRSFAKVGKRIKIRDGAIYYFGISKARQEDNSTKKLPYEFKGIDENTNYLRLSSFDASLYSQLDSFYKSIDKEIKSKPNLIVDIRDNGGGSESCFFPLLQYSYTKPIVVNKLELWATDDNIKLYEDYVGRMKKDSNNFGVSAIQSNELIIEKMKKADRHTFIAMSDKMPEPIVMDSVYKFPSKIILLQNRFSASSAEGFIFMMSQSDKVVTAGENSGGFVGFGNVLPSQTPGGCFVLNCTTMKYGDQYKYEFTGRPPRKYIPASADWIQYAQRMFK